MKTPEEMERARWVLNTAAHYVGEHAEHEDHHNADFLSCLAGVLDWALDVEHPGNRELDTMVSNLEKSLKEAGIEREN